MKLCVKENSNVEEIEVHVLCQKRDERVNKIVSLLTGNQKTILAKDNNQKTIMLNIYQVYYVEVIDKKSFVYTKDQVYELHYKLYELEDLLPDNHFIRISKSIIINISKISSIETEEGRRLKLTLENGEIVLISRTYVKDFKEKIGLK